MRLELSEAASDAIARRLGDARAIHEDARFHDTPDDRLGAAGVTLSVRKTAEGRIQVLEQGGHRWTRPLPEGGPETDWHPLLRGLLGDAPVAERFRIVLDRREWFTDGVTLTLEEGRITARAREAQLRECVLFGPAQDLFDLARRMGDDAAVRLAVLSPPERGYLLLGAQPERFKAAQVALVSGLTVGEAFHRIAWACIRQYRLNEDLILATRAEDAVHQARVALRRLRSAFSIFKPVLEGGGDIAAELRWLAGILGPVRDLDVLLPHAPTLRAARDEACTQAVAELSSARARAAMMDLAEWLETGAWRDAPAIGDPVEGFAAAALDRWQKRVRKDGRGLKRLPDEARHELRKDAKKLRYASEFFAPLFGHRKRKRRFLSALGDLQDHLGALNDLANAPVLAERFDLVLPRMRKKPLLRNAKMAHDGLVEVAQFWR